jgi:hypothetical protein
MISDLLRARVDQYVTELRSSTILQQANAGALRPSAIASYIEGLRYLTKETVRLLRLAAEQAGQTGDAELGAHYQKKVREEVGHDRWAENDLRKLASTFSLREAPRSSRALSELTSRLQTLIEERPVTYLGYLLLVERMTVLLGPEWLTSLDQACGVPSDHLTVVRNHVELDQEHVDDGLEEIDRLAKDGDLESMLATIEESTQLLSAFLDEVLELARAA